MPSHHDVLEVVLIVDVQLQQLADLLFRGHESYSGGQPLNTLSDLIQGRSIGLTGVKVGSRVLLQIPPAFGYGAQGSGEPIPGNATLWFGIDVVKAE